MERALPLRGKSIRDKFTLLASDAVQFIDRFYRAPAGYVILDESGSIVDCNRNFAVRLGKHPAQVRETPFIDHICDQFREEFISALAKAEKSASPIGCPIAFVPGSGRDTVYSYLTILKQCCYGKPKSTEFRIVSVDDFQNDLIGAAIKREREKANLYFDIAGVFMIVINKDGTVMEINRKGTEILECPVEMVVGKNWFDTFLPVKIREKTFDEFKNLLSAESTSAEYFENPIVTLTGKEKIIAWHSTVMRDETKAVYASLSSGIDISLQRKIEAQLRINASIDHMTGIFNRREGYVLLESMLAKSFSERKPVTICLLDLNNLKYINDVFGHLEGDIVIMQTAKLISRNIKQNDVVFRLGGDEFLIIFQKCNMEIAEFILERLKLAFDKHNAESGKTFSITWCAGIAEWNDREMGSIEDLIRTADKNMYRQKKEFYALTTRK